MIESLAVLICFYLFVILIFFFMFPQHLASVRIGANDIIWFLLHLLNDFLVARITPSSFFWVFCPTNEQSLRLMPSARKAIEFFHLITPGKEEPQVRLTDSPPTVNRDRPGARC
jgi:hypothetical protein